MMVSQIINEKLLELENSKQTPQNSRSKIQRVAGHLRNREKFKEHYLPKFVSIGPIHHGSSNLMLGEKYKLMWAANYMDNTKQRPEDLYQKIAINIDELKGHFDDNVLTLTDMSLEGFGSLEEKLSWMLFVDGCSLLHILHYNESMNINTAQMDLVIRDVLLLENQLPYVILKLLWKDNNDSELIKCMRNFLNYQLWGICECESQLEKEEDVVSIREGEGQHILSIPNESQSETSTHLLDLQRKIILSTSNSKTKSNEAINTKRSKMVLLKIKNRGQELLQKIKNRSQMLLLKINWGRELLRKIKNWNQKNSKKNGKLITYKNMQDGKLITYRNIQDLRAVGIRLKVSATQSTTDIDFSAGWFTAELILPEIVVDDTSAATFLNLIAYETCPDFLNNYAICSFAAFMDSLIDHPEDVKELRSKGILQNSLGSDEEVANLFNILGTDVVYNTEIYSEVRDKIHEHYCNKCKTWIALGFHTYFNNPWAIIAFLAAFIALALTFIQAWFAINPASK